MINRLNLASRPFRNRTLPWTVAAVVMCVSLLSLILVIRNARQANLQAEAVAADVAAEQAKVGALQARAAQVMGALSLDEVQNLRPRTG
ncbi:MAG: hypothetical protein WKF84_17310 [Pyrinomonadaceae bacterium]